MSSYSAYIKDKLKKPVEQKPVEQKPVEQKPVEQKPVEQKLPPISFVIGDGTGRPNGERVTSITNVADVRVAEAMKSNPVLPPVVEGRRMLDYDKFKTGR